MSHRSIEAPPPRVLGGLRGHHGAAAGPAASLPAAPEAAPPAPGPLELICQRPRALLQRRFLSSEECRRLIDMTLGRQRCGSVFEKKARSPLEVSDPRWDPEQRAFLERIEARLAAIMGGPVHADEDALVGTLTPPGGEESIADHLGLHVDTNAAPWRFCTAIIYAPGACAAGSIAASAVKGPRAGAGPAGLSSVQRGGETVFPVALRPGAARGEEAPGLAAAAQELLDLGVDHTDKAKVGQGGPAAAAAAQRLLAAARRTDAGVRVAPEEGTVCVFWTRLDDGEVDCHSWHAGAPVPKGDNWKWTLQKFKEVPMSVRSSSAALADFVRGTRHLATAAVAGEAAGSPDG
ncbi:unnamed protein product [Prorocentrum cordatum]|uniref:Prolyl 4-hydroxylase alpha subunit domain-containing protein n=1 Tax=Prorocentrum cordatum TaxID=2364126 RepID=A0ABN9T3A7_9DINO|nr:unnamed protein product [Polarella glacialis]